MHELRQTDFSYFRIVGWGWYYLSTVMDDYSRYILAWKLSASMAATDVMETLDMARAQAGMAGGIVIISEEGAGGAAGRA